MSGGQFAGQRNDYTFGPEINGQIAGIIGQIVTQVMCSKGVAPQLLTFTFVN